MVMDKTSIEVSGSIVADDYLGQCLIVYIAFKYTTPKLRLDHDSLDDNLLTSKSFHLICSPERCIDLVENILQRRERLHDTRALRRPLFIWEPVPDLCVPDQLEACRAALRYVDVISPNHTELCGFFGTEAHRPDGSIGNISSTPPKLNTSLTSNRSAQYRGLLSILTQRKV